MGEEASDLLFSIQLTYISQFCLMHREATIMFACGVDYFDTEAMLRALI
jgi:hypothetical protein